MSDGRDERAGEAPRHRFTIRHEPQEQHDFAELGAQVTGVFTAAEKAAQQMLAMARDEAEDVRRRAQAEVETLRAQRRMQAEEEARRIVAEAQAEAQRIREAAQATAWELEDGVRKRVQRVIDDASVLEERLEWAREGLRDVGSRLDEVAPRARSALAAHMPPPPAPVAADDPDGDSDDPEAATDEGPDPGAGQSEPERPWELVRRSEPTA